jgi:glyoxylase I family protein
MYASYRRLRARLVHPLPAEILLIRDNPAADAVGLRPSLDPDPLLGAPSQNVKGVETGATCRLTRPRSFRDDPSESRSLGSVPRMPIKLENVGIAVRDLEATIAFFTDLGLTVLGRDTVSGEWTDTAVGLDGNHANIAMLQAPDGNGRLELFQYIHPDAIETEPTQPNEIGMHRVAFSVDDIEEALEIAARHGCHPLRGVATYGDVYKLTYVRGPSGIIVMLAEELKKS